MVRIHDGEAISIPELAAISLISLRAVKGSFRIHAVFPVTSQGLEPPAANAQSGDLGSGLKSAIHLRPILVAKIPLERRVRRLARRWCLVSVVRRQRCCSVVRRLDGGGDVRDCRQFGICPVSRRSFVVTTPQTRSIRQKDISNKCAYASRRWCRSQFLVRRGIFKLCCPAFRFSAYSPRC